jgi:hypothetical protein
LEENTTSLRRTPSLAADFSFHDALAVRSLATSTSWVTWKDADCELALNYVSHLEWENRDVHLPPIARGTLDTKFGANGFDSTVLLLT